MTRTNRSRFRIAAPLVWTLALALGAGAQSSVKINRAELVKRHAPRIGTLDRMSPFTVGNGEFAFTADVTGLQTFAEEYESGISLGTLSHWGWHSVANPRRYELAQASSAYDTYGRKVRYASERHSPAGQWLRANPHRLHLGRIGFCRLAAAAPVGAEHLTSGSLADISQSLNLWEGILTSAFTLDGVPVFVETACDSAYDQLGVHAQSELILSKQLGVLFQFPYGSLSWGKDSADWNSPQRHASQFVRQQDNFAVIERRLDRERYFVRIAWDAPARLEQIGAHQFLLRPLSGDRLQFTCNFSAERPAKSSLRTVEQVFRASQTRWRNFWESGGAVELAAGSDPRALELERRVVLSQYLTAVQCAGSLPPAETGLTCNSWHGKFHLEMHWWHGVHFVLWGRPELLENSLDWYRRILPAARRTAKLQGYAGARWPKMVGPDGRESPSDVGAFLIWQQPHPIYYAELLYQAHPDRDYRAALLKRFKKIVFESAEFMADYAHFDETRGRWVLGPPLIPAQEIYPAATTSNPAFELSYWRYGLQTAQRWRRRLGLAPDPRWAAVIDGLAPLPSHDGLYLNIESAADTFTNEWHRRDHPTVLGALGLLPNDQADPEMMARTLEAVMQSWNWESTWGWDYPLIAMTAARVGRPDLALDALLLDTQKNTYLTNGHNYQDDRLTLYLPGNGGLLTAVAMMAAGWNGAPLIPAPGFPQDGSWTVRYEGLNPLP